MAAPLVSFLAIAEPALTAAPTTKRAIMRPMAPRLPRIRFALLSLSFLAIFLHHRWRDFVPRRPLIVRRFFPCTENTGRRDKPLASTLIWMTTRGAGKPAGRFGRLL